ncbi:MAG: archaeal proteasome endopeptidase complex subunit alpha [Candidatus Aenigmarchaeota archaeon]|nr:archaeal proteasome endopeptidase complex subunit alpha [Candidatus Aenigmarchaeota archaeon]
MGYDRAIVTFSPDGRLFQVEYAREAVKRGTTSVGLVFDKGIVLVGSKPVMELAVPDGSGEKVFQIDDHLGGAISGFLADGRVLIDASRVKAQVYKLTYDEPMNVLGSVKEISDRMQLFTQYGGVRPYGVAFLMGGIDENGAQLFEVDPSSAYYGWKAHSIGRGAPEALKLLRKSWKENLKQEDAIKLAIQALRAGEKSIKITEVELAVVNEEGFTKYHGSDGIKFIKKYW